MFRANISILLTIASWPAIYGDAINSARNSRFATAAAFLKLGEEDTMDVSADQIVSSFARKYSVHESNSWNSGGL
jgi:hypothetical protein